MDAIAPKQRIFRRTSYDVIIVGARCAGAALAIMLARAGARVLVLDRQPYGSDTLSTHALMRPAIIQLARWGLLDSLLEAGTPVMKSTSFIYGVGDVVTVPIRSEPGIPGLAAPRRTVLDRVLVEAARAAGAEIVHETTAQDLLRDTFGRVCGLVARHADAEAVALKAPLVVGADGIGSMVARQARSRIVHRGTVSTACIFGYAANPGLDGYAWHYSRGAAAGVIPTNDGMACIFVSAPTQRFDHSLRHDLAAGHAELLREAAPDVASRFAPGGLSGIRAFRGAPAFVREAHGPGWLLIGDAGLFRDPLTAHGISDAFRDAEGAARAILAGGEYDFHLFAEERDCLAWPVIEATEAICAFDWDFDTLKEHHKALSAAMKAEAAALATRVAMPGFEFNGGFHADAHAASS